MTRLVGAPQIYEGLACQWGYIYFMFDFKIYVMKIMSKSPTRHPFSLQVKLNINL